LKEATVAMAAYQVKYFPGENTAQFKICNNCYKVCKTNNIPPMSRRNGSAYSPKLHPLTERHISPRIPYMQIRRLRREGSYGIIGQVINVAVDVDTMVRSLPRSLDDDYAFNVNLKRNIINQSSYLSGSIKNPP
jgi:hypothetical protein